ncbi:hypothetical protein MLD38_018864 [Melastoma candidum]|uniref:Uncharacterized protein n=1 Tax=Melastoma candidum TaxID=119954 RepID=A0ACB9QVA6_9MYRT|nr:hypothetical protein MLD38_018864 [Melastoma candidum]
MSPRLATVNVSSPQGSARESNGWESLAISSFNPTLIKNLTITPRLSEHSGRGHQQLPGIILADLCWNSRIPFHQIPKLDQMPALHSMSQQHADPKCNLELDIAHGRVGEPGIEGVNGLTSVQGGNPDEELVGGEGLEDNGGRALGVEAEAEPDPGLGCP